ncbi:inositol phosphate phosphatase SopB, partial [Salmonella enterica subsp. enterica serovar Infantis]
QDGLHEKEAHRFAPEAFRDYQVKHLNNQPWQTKKNTLTHNWHHYNNTQLPAAEIKIGAKEIYHTAYEVKGVSSCDT